MLRSGRGPKRITAADPTKKEISISDFGMWISDFE